MFKNIMKNKLAKMFSRSAVAMAIAIGFVAAIEMSPILMGCAAFGMVSGAFTEIYVVKH